MKPALTSKTVLVNLAVVILAAILQYLRGLPMEATPEPGVVEAQPVQSLHRPLDQRFSLLCLAGLAGVNLGLRAKTKDPIRWL